ncbi:MAG: flagellar hook-basal body complex protein FliE [Rickettsiales bacterium]|nr:flagellar hook-basal body complex protein FliE [Rickettsiales bacterium]|tara:strand:+ start:233 stop:556 length:324 start_codon:yes stop_codon:yes gene_type:complete
MSNLIPGAISAYQSAGKLSGDSTGKVDLGEKKPNALNTFADLIQDGVETVVTTQKASESATADYMAGKADINDVVMAVRNAEITLYTVTAIRDRVVNSLQEVLRMPI